MLVDFTNSGLDTLSQRCDKCEHKTHSEGLLREHQKNKHNIKESQQNIIKGFEFDMQRHLSVLELMEEGLDKYKCEKCIYKTHTEGKLESIN